MIVEEDHSEMVLTAHKLLRNGLRDIVERQEVAEILTRTAHILRGPLMEIQGELEALKDHVDSSDLEKTVVQTVCSKIEDQVDAIAVHAELMEAARRIGRERIEKPWFRSAPLASIIDKVCQGMLASRIVRGRGIWFESLKAIRALPDVEFDWNQMRIIFANLLHNACKYAHNGTAIEFLGEQISLAGKPGIQVTIVDFGIGIKPEEIDREIFRPGFRGTVRDLKRDIEGTGVGLAVCKEIVEDGHHGRIGACCTEISERDLGTYQHCRVEFYIKLPIKQTNK